MTEKITTEVAFQKGYLEKKKIHLKPVPKGGKMISSPAHIAYFQMEGASNWFQLPKDANKGTLVNPFESEEEKEFFEDILDVNLSVHRKQDNFWNTFFVKVKKDYNLMHDGYVFDLSDPWDNLRYRVTKLQSFVAPSWDERFSRGEYKFALVDEGFEEAKAAEKTDKMTEAFMKYGEVRTSVSKMSDILGVYFLEKHKMDQVPEDASKEWLQKELYKIVQDENELFLQIANDPESKIKNLIVGGIRVGAVIKEARNKYTLPGEGTSYTYKELVDYLSGAEKLKEDVYLKLVAQVNKK